ncbi:serine/threonine-protein kinase Sgk1-like [Protopterus annectens]|uniref:serine/threonine-protein kinase Sgk1-like n=1 Tax=Protopterus annectens TaxID=7888 RepID=UPI001CFA95D5|nr:serine/threonine-protein kinase Sgk1-like [Protopterus annectens]
MGAAYAPSYAIIYMDSFERKFIYSTDFFKKNVVLYKRFIDDLIFICKGDISEFLDCFEMLNNNEHKLQFSYEVNRSEINFLDLTLFEKENKIQFRPYRKQTSVNMFLHATSMHPPHLINALPQGEFKRIRDHTSMHEEMDKELNSVLLRLLERGYDYDHLLWCRDGRTDENFGTYGRVHEAFAERWRCNVAVKIISKKNSPEVYVRKFLPRELQAMKTLKHKNITSLYQVIETTSYIYIAEELASGGDVAGWVSDHGACSEEQTDLKLDNLLIDIDGNIKIADFGFARPIENQNLSRTFCGTRSYMPPEVLLRESYNFHMKMITWECLSEKFRKGSTSHHSNTSHKTARDLKLDNLLTDIDGNIKIADFGFARPIENQNLGRTFCGTRSYMPPEVLLRERYNPFLFDMWSLGTILYILVTGQFPYEDDNMGVFVRNIQKGVHFPPQKHMCL